MRIAVRLEKTHGHGSIGIKMTIAGSLLKDTVFHGPTGINNEEADRIISFLKHGRKPHPISLNINHGGTVAQIFLDFVIGNSRVIFKSPIFRGLNLVRKAESLEQKIRAWDAHFEQ